MKITSTDTELSNNPNRWRFLLNYQTETPVFIATKHEKTSMAVI